MVQGYSNDMDIIDQLSWDFGRFCEPLRPQPGPQVIGGFGSNDLRYLSCWIHCGGLPLQQKVGNDLEYENGKGPERPDRSLFKQTQEIPKSMYN